MTSPLAELEQQLFAGFLAYFGSEDCSEPTRRFHLWDLVRIDLPNSRSIFLQCVAIYEGGRKAEAAHPDTISEPGRPKNALKIPAVRLSCAPQNVSKLPLLSPLPLPRCWVCKKPVDRLSISEDGNLESTEITVRCHGQKQSVRIPNELIEYDNPQCFAMNWAFRPSSTALPASPPSPSPAQSPSPHPR